MKFEYPIWLLVATIMVPLIAWAFYCFHRARVEALKKFAAERLLEALTASVSPGLRSAKHWLFAIAIALCLAALARPQAGFRWQEVKRKGIDILFAVDTSKSMLAQDVNPDRLTRAKLAVADLVEKLEGDRVGLIAFSGSSFLQCPLTLDYDAFRQSLDALDTSIIPKGGTDISTAIKEAGEAFNLGGQNHKILVILTDGEDLESNGIAAAKAAAKEGLRIFTVGVGSPAGELIPVPNESGGVDFLKDEKGQTVKSKLDDATLRKIAEETGGAYEPLGRQGEGLEAIYQHGLAEVPKQELASRMNKIYIERFQWPLALAILFLVIETMLGERKITGYGVRGTGYRFGFARKQTVPAAPVSLALLMLATSAWASPRSAEKAYGEGKYPEAAKEYKAAADAEPKKAELQYNVGASTYKSKAYTDASAAFQKALKTDDVKLQQQTFYNLGNTQYRIGQETEKSNPKQTIQTWEQALKSYEAAMQLKKDDADAKFNYEFVKKKLEELQKQQEQQEQQKQDKQEKQEKQDQKDQQQDQQKNDQQKNQDQNKDQKKDQKDQSQDQNKDPQQNDQQNKDQKKDEQNEDHNKDKQGQNPDQQQQQNPSGGSDKDQQQKQDPKDQADQPQPNPSGGDQQKDEQKQPEQDGQDQAKQDQKKDSKPEPKDQPGKPGDRKYDKDKKGEESEPQLLPGQMSKEEAKNLLDSLKGDEKKMPVAVESGQGAGWEDAPRRDW